MERLLFLALFFFIGCSTPPRQPMISQSREIAQLPPSPQESKPKETAPARKPIIFIDAGHGGTDPGAHSKQGRHFQEKTLALETARRVEQHLLQWGYRVAMSRRKDVVVPLHKRVQMADKQNADIFVSLHFNSAPNTAIHGSEVFYYHTSKATIKTKDSKRLATSILKRLCETLPAQSRGVKHGNLCVVRETKMPAVLVESAFLSSPYDLKRLSTLAFRQKIAWAIAKGIDDYYCMR